MFAGQIFSAIKNHAGPFYSSIQDRVATEMEADLGSITVWLAILNDESFLIC